MAERKEYIDRQNTLSIVDSYGKTVDKKGKVVVDAIRDIVGTIAPTADVVEVVRCKDCIHYQPLGDQYKYNGKPAMHCIWHSRLSKDVGYCDDGVRKQEQRLEEEQ